MVRKENLTNTEIVLQKLNETVTDVSFIVIAGDNYYPEKRIGENEKKEKIIHQDKLIKGFNLLPKKIEVNMILGNHDLETARNEGGLFVQKNNNLTDEYHDKCFILKTEQQQQQQNEDLKIVLYGTKTLNKTLLIMIDTSMYVNDSDDYLPCYQKFHKSIPKIEILRKDQEDFILGSIKSAPKTLTDIIIIGHHPIIGLKMKEAKEPKEPKELKEKKTKEPKEPKEKKTKEPKEKQLTILNDMPDFTDILKMIYRENINYHYLCADLHLYQKGIVEFNIDDRKMKINQYIVGTGGTELDDDIPKKFINNDDVHSRDDGVNYTVSECKKTFGFLECTLTPENDPIFNFVEVKPKSKQSRTSAGSKKKRRTKKKTKN